MTTRAYIRKDPGLFRRKVVEQGYSAGLYAAFEAVLCLGEEQPERGRFRSERLVRLLLDEPKDGVHLRWGRFVGELIERGDLVRLADGSLYIDGWDEWQEGDVTVRDRMARLRNRKKSVVTDEDTGTTVTGDTGPTVTTPSRATTRAPSAAAIGRSGGKSPSGDTPRAPRNGVDPDVVELQLLAEDLTQHPYVMQNVLSGLGLKAVEAMRKHGRQRVEAEWRRITEGFGGQATLRQLVLGADDVLNPVPSASRLTPEQRETAEREAIVARYGRRDDR